MRFLLSLTALVSLATVAPAEHHKAQLAPSTLYAAGGWGSGDDALYQMDRTTGALTRVGDFGTTDAIPYIAYDSKTDKFYSITAYGRYLYSIDRHTGQASYVGPTGLWKTFALAFSPSGDLYAVNGQVLGDQIVYVNKLDAATGAIISKTPTNLRLEASFSIAFDNLGRLWIATAEEGPHGRLFAIDPTTGKGVAPLVPILDGCRSIAIDAETQVMYNVHAGYGQLPNAFTTIDPSTGAETAIAILPIWVAISLVPEPIILPGP